MFVAHRQTRPISARITVAVASTVALAAGAVSAPSVHAASVQVGYRDFSYGSSVTAPTGQKPESKLWYTQDNVCWGRCSTPPARSLRFTGSMHRASRGAPQG